MTTSERVRILLAVLAWNRRRGQRESKIRGESKGRRAKMNKRPPANMGIELGISSLGVRESLDGQEPRLGVESLRGVPYTSKYELYPFLVEPGWCSRV